MCVRAREREREKSREAGWKKGLKMKRKNDEEGR
jgi:hypothetical protein